MINRLTKCITSVLIAILIITMLPSVNRDVNAAGDFYESTWKEYNLGPNNKGYYLEPADNGKYPALIFIHGVGGFKKILTWIL